MNDKYLENKEKKMQSGSKKEVSKEYRGEMTRFRLRKLRSS